jgi:hypothetical protein
MRYSTPLLGLVGAAAGLVVAATGYQLAAAPVAPAPSSSDALAAVGRPLPAAPAEVRKRFLPCVAPAKLHHGVCVTHEWRTTVVYDQPAAPAPAPLLPAQGAAGPVPATAPVAQREHEDDEYDEHADDHEDDGHDEEHEAEEPGHHELGDD